MNHILVAGVIVLIVFAFFVFKGRKNVKPTKKAESLDEKIKRLNEKYFPEE